MYMYNWITLLYTWNWHSSVNQLCCSVAQSCLILYNPMDCNTPGFPVLHYLLELLTLMPVESMMSSNHLVLVPSCLQSFPASGSFQMSQLFASGGQSIGVSASASVLPMNIQLISFRIDWFDLLTVQGTLKSLLQHHSSKASIFQHSTFFIVQVSHPYITTGKTIAVTIWIFFGKIPWTEEPGRLQSMGSLGV